MSFQEEVFTTSAAVRRSHFGAQPLGGQLSAVLIHPLADGAGNTLRRGDGFYEGHRISIRRRGRNTSEASCSSAAASAALSSGSMRRVWHQRLRPADRHADPQAQVSRRGAGGGDHPPVIHATGDDQRRISLRLCCARCRCRRSIGYIGRKMEMTRAIACLQFEIEGSRPLPGSAPRASAARPTPGTGRGGEGSSDTRQRVIAAVG